ncbi:MAG: NusA-like transcription termination signal-binding factor [Candidatus Diapherotrites archaeon]|nr:NusA-like transcription termination signal-binding factor [Candidatus Diapherotrites archaeon]
MLKLTKDELQYMNAFQAFTGVMARDCVILDDTIVFVVKEEEVGKAIGKNGQNVKSLSNRTKKKIQIIPYCKEIETFIRQVFRENKIETVTRQDQELIVTTNNADKKKILQNKWKFLIIKEVAKRNYEIENIKIK